MIELFDVIQDDRKIAVYTNIITSSFTFSEFLTRSVWGRLNDRIGRKFILIMKLTGTDLSMKIFSFISNFRVAMLSRALGGLLNNNTGVLYISVAEIITVKKY